MNRGLRPVLESIEWDGCPVCGEVPRFIEVNGPDEIRLTGCGHVIDARPYLG